MAMTDDQKDDGQKDGGLETLFAAGRKAGAEVSVDFMARLVADMEGAIPEPERPAAVVSPRRNWLAGIFTVSGLSGAVLAGVWIGFAVPQTLEFSTGAETSFELSYLLPGADLGSVFDE